MPKGLNAPLKHAVATIQVARTTVEIGEKAAYDMEKRHARLLLVSHKRDDQLLELFLFELAPVLPLLFDEYGDMRKSSTNIMCSKLAKYAANYLEPLNLELTDSK